MKVEGESEVAQSRLTSAWTFQAPPSMGFSRQEYRSGVPLPPPNVQDRCPQTNKLSSLKRKWKVGKYC